VISTIFEYEALDLRVLDDCRLVMAAEAKRALRAAHYAKAQGASRGR